MDKFVLMTTREVDACLRKIKARKYGERAFLASLQGIKMPSIEAKETPKMTPEEERKLENVMIQALRDKKRELNGNP